MTPEERKKAMVRALRRLIKHHAAMNAAYERMSEADQKGRGSPEWQHARDLVNRAEIDLWNLMEWNECLLYEGRVYTRGSNMDVSCHRPLSLEGVRP